MYYLRWRKSFNQVRIRFTHWHGLATRCHHCFFTLCEFYSVHCSINRIALYWRATTYGERYQYQYKMFFFLLRRHCRCCFTFFFIIPSFAHRWYIHIQHTYNVKYTHWITLYCTYRGTMCDRTCQHLNVADTGMRNGTRHK